MKINSLDPRHQVALDDMREQTGLNISDVLLPNQWAVMLVDGHPMVIVNEDGMRALALMAPRPDAIQFTEDIIRQIRAGDA